MIWWLATLVWLGGIDTAFRRTRESGKGWAYSALNAAIWPFGVGIYIAENFYDPE